MGRNLHRSIILASEDFSIGPAGRRPPRASKRGSASRPMSESPRLPQADAEALIRDHGVRADSEARQGQRDEGAKPGA
jgi:hypothetical protein